MNNKFTLLSILLLTLFISGSYAQEGEVTWEKFKPFSGTFAELATAEGPVETQILTSIDAPQDIDDNYSARITGFIIVPETGDYKFYVSSDDGSELWLSSDITVDNLSMLCNVTSWASHGAFNKEANQASGPVHLEAGSFHYFRALMKEGSGGDHLEVAWTTPSNATITIIGTDYISSEAVVDSTLSEIQEFEFTGIGVPVTGVVDSAARTIQVEVPYGVNITTLVPAIVTSYGATLDPADKQPTDFTNPVDYTVTSADGDYSSVFTVTVTTAAARDINTITNVSLDFGVVSINGTVDDMASTITFDIYSGLPTGAKLMFDKDYFATVSNASGDSIDLNTVTELEVTAQNGDIKTYSLIYNSLAGVAAFSDNFSDDSNMANWAVRNWNNSGTGNIFTISHDPAEENLVITKTTSVNDYIRFTFPQDLNVGLVKPYVRFRVKSAQALTRFEAKLQDVNAPLNDGNFSQATNMKMIAVPADGEYHEAIWDYSTGMNNVNPFQIKYLVLGVDRTIGVALSNVRVDDFRAGIDAYANNKPTVNTVAKPHWAYIGDGVQTVALTGISDGNPERDEIVTITATSSNQAVVADGDITVDYDGVSSTATLSYTPSSNGPTVITVTLKDDRGTVYSDEEDTETTQFIAEFRDATPGVNDVATFGMPQFTHINVGQGVEHYVIISQVDDGDADVDQVIFFDYVNNSPELIVIDSIVYNPGESFALIYFRDLGMTGNASLTLSCIDEVDQTAGNDPFELTFDIPLETYNTFGCYYGATQIAQWQDYPYKQDPVFKDGYPVTLDKADVHDLCKDDFFWGMMWGYVIAPVTGDYKFYSTTEGEGVGPFYLSTNNSRDGLPPLESWTAQTDQASGFIHLEAGQAYYFEAFHKEIVNDYFLTLEWIYPGLSAKEIIGKPYLFTSLDMEAPSSATSLRIKAKGSTQALIEWDASTDNLKVKGYYVYINGELYNEEMTTETSMMIESLETETGYDIFVLAQDGLKNYSLPSNVLSFTTWGSDANPPSIPENLAVTEKTAFSISLNWDAASDAETEVFGYNVYVNGEQINDKPIIGTIYKIHNLDKSTDYSITVTALDAALNESAQSDAVSETTNDFAWDDPNEDAHIGKATLTFSPLAVATGFGVEGGYELGSIFVSNKISYNSFEDPSYKNNASTVDLAAVKKTKSGGVTYYAETSDVYQGQKSARLEVGPGDWFRCSAGIVMTPNYHYLLRFAAKSAASYAGSAINLRVYRDIGGVVTAFTGSVKPTTEWAEYEIEFPGIQDASGSWYVEFAFNKLGTVYLDDLQLHIKEWYNPGSKFTTVGMKILDELQPAGIRWGGIGANYEDFNLSVGAYQKGLMTFGDFAYLSSLYGGYAQLTVGVNSATDWMKNPSCFSNFIEYLAGPAGTPWGDVRIAEGYTQPFDQMLKGIIIEMGNEVWGFDAHGADGFSSDYAKYAPWARTMTTDYIKASDYFNPDKMFVSFSGRSPESNYGLHDKLFNGDDGEMDMLDISGYLGGNLSYDPAIDPGQSQLDYHKNSYAVFKLKLDGLIAIYKDMFKYMSRRVPMYMYEGNLTVDAYHGTLGQAVSFADYYATVMDYGVTVPDVFCLEGGQWRLLDDQITLKKRPLYYMVEFYNRLAGKGVVLKTDFETVDKIYNDNGVEVKLPSVGVHAFNNDKDYGVVLFSRDFENDYIVSLDLPDDIGTITDGHIITVTGDMFNSPDVVVDSSALTVEDGMLITVPKHGAVFVSFKADSRTYDPMPEIGQFNYQKIESIDLTTTDGETTIESLGGRKKLTYTISPDNAFYAAADVKIVDNPANAAMSTSLNVTADTTKNGTVTIRATAKDNSGVYDEITITIINQHTLVQDVNSPGVKYYPNPVSDYMIIEFPDLTQATLTIRNVHGSIVQQNKMKDTRTLINTSNLANGVYFVTVESSGKTEVFRFVKQ